MARYLAHLKAGVKHNLPTGWGGASPLAKSLAKAMLTQFLPGSKCLVNVVLRVFESIELPRLEAEVQAVCAAFGSVVNIARSKVPLSEVRPYPQPGARSVPRDACAMCATGLFNVFSSRKCIVRVCMCM